ncbi:MAG: DUF1631 family protein, partial [Massilia sp.]
MDNSKQVVALAKQQALTSFSSLVASTLDEAALLLAQASRSASGDEQRVLSGARMFLQDQGRALRARMESHFAGYLDRALQTMHTDLRTGLHDMNADTMSLIDDEVVVRQIEVDRLVIRLRDADELALGRINLTIAQLHGVSEARERENPFRPYLLARALHEGLRELVRNEGQAKLLFDYLSTAMASKLGGYYTAILEVFQSRGLHSQLKARPSALSRHERERDGWQRAAEQMLGNANSGLMGMEDPAHAMRASMLPKLQNLIAAQSAPPVNAVGGSNSVPPGQPHELQDLVWQVFNQAKGARRMREGPPASMPPTIPRVTALDMQLRQLQQSAADPEHADTEAAPLTLREQLTDVADTGADRVTIDLVALLFECINFDEQVPPALRQQLARLHIPFLRAALADQSVLHNADHPARRLLDQIGTLGAGMTPGTPSATVTEAVIGRVLDKVLASFDADPAVFANGGVELDAAVAPLLRTSEDAVLRCAEAMEQAEALSTSTAQAADALAALLWPLRADTRVTSFVTDFWSRVLARGGPEYAALLPELLWSAQEKATAEDRAVLMKLLPKLVGRVREGLALLHLSAEQSKAALDQLVAVHMDVLGNKQVQLGDARTLAQFEAHFQELGAAMAAVPPARCNRAELEAALAQRKVDADLHTEPASLEPVRDDSEWLAWARPGAGFEIMSDGAYKPYQLRAASPHGSAFLFCPQDQGAPAIVIRPALLQGMR